MVTLGWGVFGLVISLFMLFLFCIFFLAFIHCLHSVFGNTLLLDRNASTINSSPNEGLWCVSGK